MDESQPKQWADRVEDAVRRVESITVPEARSVALDLLQVVMEYHAAALSRILEIVGESCADEALAALAGDDLTSSLLLLHGLHPESFDVRINRAVQQLRLHLNPCGADVVLLGTEDGVVRLRYESSRNGHDPALKELIEGTVFQFAPEAAEVLLEGLREPAPAGFVPLSTLVAGHAT